MPPITTKRLFTVDDFLRMAESGIFRGDGDRVELIQGEILAMSPIGPPHGAAVAQANRVMVNLAGDKAVVWIQTSARLDEYTAPQSDILLLEPREDFYASRLPEPQDMLLVVEVADSSLAYDREIKRDLYAAARVPEYWIADIQNRRLFVYSDPVNNTYRASRSLRPGERIAPRLLPECEIDVSILLPSVTPDS